MAGIIDTNILLYAANKDSDEHPAAAEFLFLQFPDIRVINPLR